MLLYNEQKLEYNILKMKSLTDLPNSGKTRADKLNLIGISNEWELKEFGSENTHIALRSHAPKNS